MWKFPSQVSHLHTAMKNVAIINYHEIIIVLKIVTFTVTVSVHVANLQNILQYTA